MSAAQTTKKTEAVVLLAVWFPMSLRYMLSIVLQCKMMCSTSSPIRTNPIVRCMVPHSCLSMSRRDRSTCLPYLSILSFPGIRTNFMRRPMPIMAAIHRNISAFMTKFVFDLSMIRSSYSPAPEVIVPLGTQAVAMSCNRSQAGVAERSLHSAYAAAPSYSFRLADGTNRRSRCRATAL